MKALANETFIPTVVSGKGKAVKTLPDPKCKGYEIKALTSLQLTEVLCDGSDEIKMNNGMKFSDVTRLLNFGLVDSSIIEDMPAVHHIQTAKAILDKAFLLEEERKN